MLNFADSAITYRLRFFIHDFSERFRIDSKVREAIWYHFHREGVEIPFPIRTISPRLSHPQPIKKTRALYQCGDDAARQQQHARI